MPNLKYKLILISGVLLANSSSFAATPTPAQIAQFQALPKHQQEMLAKEMGVDLSSLAVSTSIEQSEPDLDKKPPGQIRATKPRLQEAPKDLNAEVELSHFGYDVFSGEALDFTPVDNLPVPIDYQIAPGDEIRVQLFGKSYNDFNLEVDRDGKINIPGFGPEYVIGQTLGELKLYIDSLIKQKAIGVDAVVSLSEMRTMQVFITGDVAKPGAYNVNGLTTLSQAMIASGGVNTTGSLRDIQVKRMGNTVVRFDAYDLLVNGDSSDDVRLQAGDTIFVPLRKSSVAIKGEVYRPAYYELIGDTSIGKLLELAGGALPTAYLSKVNIRRSSSSGVEKITLDLSLNKSRQFEVLAGDEVSLLPIGESVNNAIVLRGEFVTQGAFEFVPNARISDVIHKQDLKENADLNYALLVRESNAERDISVLQFNLGEVLSDPSSSSNIKLQIGDQLFVFDNGLDLDYWYRKEKSQKGLVSKELESKDMKVFDSDTGAFVELEREKRLTVGNIDQFSYADNVKLSNRETLLKPIIERLKAQADLANPAQLIKVSGAVKYPGVYPLAINSNFKQVVQAAGGFSEQAYLYNAELSRAEKTKNDFVLKHFSFSPNEVISGVDQLEIAPLDHIVIKTQPNWQRDYSVELQGEVVFPGTYTFRRGETLQDVIERAGGLTQYAYPHGAVFSRESLKRQEQERLKLLNLQLKQEIGNLALRRQNSSATYTTSPSEALTIADELATTEAVGRLVINLPEALAGDVNSDLMLEKGDKLYIPARQPVISVMGEVQFASNHTYQPSMSIEDYISSAGGTKKQADTDRVYVVRADGSVVFC